MSCTCASYGSYIGNINCPSLPLPNLGLPCPPVTTVGTVDSINVLYSGPNLTCGSILTGDNLQVILGKISTQLCASLGNIGSYNTHCLAPITTWQQFVETISSYVCTTQASLTTFISSTFPTYQTTVTNALAAITNPGITGCGASGILAGDALNTIIIKLSNSICDIYNNKLSLAGVNWAQCFAIGNTPTTIAAGFSTVISQICQLNTYIQTSGIGGTLPTFNTTGSCLPSPSTTDTLVSTVNKLIVRTCQAGTFDINALTWGCTVKPSTVTTDLQGAFQAVLSKVTTLTQNFPVFSSDFIVTNVDNSQPCLGKFIKLATSLDQDRFVAATPADVSPGTLQDKLVAGTNVNLDYFATVGKVTINSTGGTSDHKVASDSTDISPDYLIGKVEPGGYTYGIRVVPILDTSTSKVAFNISIDPVVLMQALLNILTPGADVTAQFCTAVASCPSPCNPPTNVTVTYSSSGTTTTTTTT